MSQQEFTMALAVWGAITGTIGTISGLLGLWLRFRQHSLDKARIKCESSFGFKSPTRPLHKVVIRSVGRRPVAVDFIRYYFLPRNKWHRLTKRLQHKKGKWLWDQKPRNRIRLAEGEKSEVEILPPNGLRIDDIYKAKVVDELGSHWTVKWPSVHKLSKIATGEKIASFEEENKIRICSAVGYRLGEQYYLEIEFNTKPARMGVPSGRSFWLMDFASYEARFEDIRINQAPKFLAGEIEEIT